MEARPSVTPTPNFGAARHSAFAAELRSTVSVIPVSITARSVCQLGAKFDLIEGAGLNFRWRMGLSRNATEIALIIAVLNSATVDPGQTIAVVRSALIIGHKVQVSLS